MRTRLLIIIGIIMILILGTLVLLSTNGKNLSFNIQKPQKIPATRPEILNQVRQEESKGNLFEAKSLYEKLVNNFPNSPQVEDWQKKAGDLNIKLLFSPVITPGSVLYKIESGDSLAKIANKFNTTAELLKRSNGLMSDTILTGNNLKVWTQPFYIIVDKSQNILILKSDDQVFKTYVVSTGINNSTPIGKFKITTKLIDPPWHTQGTVIPPESPDNILGSRWMGINLAGFGIHGTTQNDKLGQQVTQGCVRMSNTDVEELFAIVPRGTEVTIVD